MLEDEAAKVEAVVFPEAFSKFGALVVDDAMLLVRGKYERDEETSRLVVVGDHAARRSCASAPCATSRSGWPDRGWRGTAMRELAGVLERHPGDRRVSVVVDVNGGPTPLRVRAATARRIQPSDTFVRDVEARLRRRLRDAQVRRDGLRDAAWLDTCWISKSRSRCC